MTPTDFSRLWSVLQFIFCQPPKPVENIAVEDMVSDIGTFGDGFSWAGCVLLHLLNQHRRFIILDFSYHILKLDSLQPMPRTFEKEKKKKGVISDEEKMIPICNVFLNNAKLIKELNEVIFSCLETYIGNKSPSVIKLHPPTESKMEAGPAGPAGPTGAIPAGPGGSAPTRTGTAPAPIAPAPIAPAPIGPPPSMPPGPPSRLLPPPPPGLPPPPSR